MFLRYSKYILFYDVLDCPERTVQIHARFLLMPRLLYFDHYTGYTLDQAKKMIKIYVRWHLNNRYEINISKHHMTTTLDFTTLK